MTPDAQDNPTVAPNPLRVRIRKGLFDVVEEPPRPLSSTRLKVLYLLHRRQPVTARGVAEYLWPNSPSSTRVSHGGVRGVGHWLAAGQLVGKMVKMGLVWRDEERDWQGRWYFRGYMLTDKGREGLLARVKIRQNLI